MLGDVSTMKEMGKKTAFLFTDQRSVTEGGILTYADSDIQMIDHAFGYFIAIICEQLYVKGIKQLSVTLKDRIKRRRFFRVRCTFD